MSIQYIQSIPNVALCSKDYFDKYKYQVTLKLFMCNKILFVEIIVINQYMLFAFYHMSDAANVMGCIISIYIHHFHFTCNRIQFGKRCYQSHKMSGFT